MGLPSPREALELGLYEPELKDVPYFDLSSHEKRLIENGVTTVVGSISTGQFVELTEMGEDLFTDSNSADLLNGLYIEDPHGREGHWAGYRRRERKVDEETGRQLADPKDLFHVTPWAMQLWAASMVREPALSKFLETGYEVMLEGLKSTRVVFEQLEVSHPGITELHYPNQGLLPEAVLRIVRYDGYDADEIDRGDEENLVAGTHLDRGTLTVQLYATDEGLYVQDPDGQMVAAPPRSSNLMYAFPGLGFTKLYADEDGNLPRVPATPHEVRHKTGEEGWVDSRTAVILFIDPFRVDLGITPGEAHMLSREYKSK